MAGNSDEDDLNLYDDLLVEDDQLLRNEQVKKTQQLGDLEKETTGQKARIAELQTELVSVKRENGILRRNISCLYKTAKAEVERKDDLLRELQRRYDAIIFRRSNEARTFLGSNGRCSAVSNDLPATSSPVPTSSSAQVFKKKPVVSSKNSDVSPRNKIERSSSTTLPCPAAVAQATAALPLAINRVSSTISPTEPVTKFARELDDEERILGYASSSAITRKKSSRKRKHDDDSISLPKPATSEHPNLENCSPKLDDVKPKNFIAGSSDFVALQNSSSNDRCSKTWPRPKSLQRNFREDSLMIQRSESSRSGTTLPRRTDNQKSSCSSSARRDTLIAKSLERPRYRNHVGRTKNLLHQQSHPGLASIQTTHSSSLDSQYSKSLSNSTPENCQNNTFPLSMSKSLEIQDKSGYRVTSRIKSPLKNNNSSPNLKLRGPSEKGYKASSENNHPTRISLKTTATVNIEDGSSGAEGLSMSIDNEPQTPRNTLDERQKANSAARGRECQLDKLKGVKRTFTLDSTSASEDKPDQIVSTSQVTILASSLTHESRVDHRRRHKTPTRDRRPASIIDGRRHDGHDSRVAADCKRRPTVVRSPLKRWTGSRISSSSTAYSRRSITSPNVDDQRRPRVNLETTLLNDARSHRKTPANSPNGRENRTRIEAPPRRRAKDEHRPSRERTQPSSTELARRSEKKATGHVDDARRDMRINRSTVNGVVVVSEESANHSSSDMVTTQRQTLMLSATKDHTDLEDGEIMSDGN